MRVKRDGRSFHGCVSWRKIGVFRHRRIDQDVAMEGGSALIGSGGEQGRTGNRRRVSTVKSGEVLVAGALLYM